MPDPTTFRIGLTMAGAVSAGAYTAGVIDFLFEALDAWESAKADPGAPVPRHRVSVEVMSGASAGSITAVIAAVLAGRRFPHVRSGTQADRLTNPLYASWVERIDIAQLLGDGDARADPVLRSALDSSVLPQIGQSAVVDAARLPPAARPWLANPLRAIFTLTNLRGVPYNVDMKGNAATAHSMMAHSDAMRFAVQTAPGAAPPAAGPGNTGHEYAVPLAGSVDDAWPRAQQMVWAALASAAFPIGLKPVELTRDRDDYARRAVLLPGEDGRIELRPIDPAWPSGTPPAYDFVSVDGGAMDNEPFELARAALAGGPLARNPRAGEQADRAVLMVDPFPEGEPQGPSRLAEVSLFSSPLQLLGAYKSQARFKPQEVALALDEDVYSRFLISPSRGAEALRSSGNHLACGALGGFGGFFARAFRVHDYLLGRRNCQRFLQRHFTLPEANPLFAAASGWTAALKDDYAVPGPRGRELPIVPLVGALFARGEGDALPLPDWPFDACDLDALRGPLEARLNVVFKSVTTDWQWKWLAGAVWKIYGEGKVLGLVTDAIHNGLVDAGLRSPAGSSSPPVVLSDGGA
jgi:predicted acylesterase/phospholipase RssA